MLTIDTEEIGHTWLNGRLQYIYTSLDKAKAESLGYYDNGAIKFHYSICNSQFHGDCFIYYEDGKIESKTPYSHGAIEGVKRCWYPAGELHLEVSYSGGLRHGYFKEWHRNGKLKSQYTFINDSPEGIWFDWYEDGRIKERIPYRDGRRHGILKCWDADGKIGSRRMFIRGVEMQGAINRLINSEELRAKHLLTMQNTAVRRICLEEIGYAQLLKQLPYDVVDKDDEQELVSVAWHKREELIFLVKVKCPSTDVFYALRVPPTIQRVRQAVAWTFNMNEGEYQPDQET